MLSGPPWPARPPKCPFGLIPSRAWPWLPEEHFHKRVSNSYNLEKARQQTLELLKAKALAVGTDPGHLEMEIVDENEFNMVRGFNTTGRIMNVKAQIKPGLIQGYDPIAGALL